MLRLSERSFKLAIGCSSTELLEAFQRTCSISVYMRKASSGNDSLHGAPTSVVGARIPSVRLADAWLAPGALQVRRFYVLEAHRL